MFGKKGFACALCMNNICDNHEKPRNCKSGRADRKERKNKENVQK